MNVLYSNVRPTHPTVHPPTYLKLREHSLALLWVGFIHGKETHGLES